MPKQKLSAYQVLKADNAALEAQVDQLSRELPRKMIELSAALKEKQDLEDTVKNLRAQISDMYTRISVMKEVYADVIQSITTP